MTRDELLAQIKLTEELIASGRPNRPGAAIAPSKITIHNTSNKSPGADAKLHSRFVRETGYYMITDPQTGVQKKNWVSWHFTVDDKIAIRQLPSNEKALHAGTMANNTSIAIEICMHTGINQQAANERAAQLTALLCFDNALPLAAVVTHNSWTGKKCPELLLESWDNFKERINYYLTQLTKAEVIGLNMIRLGLDKNLKSAAIPLCWTETESEYLTSALAHKPVQDGFNDKFLDSGKVSLPALPGSDPASNGHIFIHHQNLTIYFNKARKLALYTACNFDKDAFIQFGRSDAFRDDSFIDSSSQLGGGFYGSKSLDKTPKDKYFQRGHLIARRYNQWGATMEEAKRGERDTYYHTTIHPQVGELNNKEWNDLEIFIIDAGKLDVRRVSIVAGALLKPDDPVATYIDKFYKDERTIRVPILYWKIVYYEVENELRKIAFAMSQKSTLKKTPIVQMPAEAIRLADPFDKLDSSLKTFIINSSLIEKETQLQFTDARELYDREEPLEIIIEDNDVEKGRKAGKSENLSQFI